MLPIQVPSSADREEARYLGVGGLDTLQYHAVPCSRVAQYRGSTSPDVLPL